MESPRDHVPGQSHQDGTERQADRGLGVADRVPANRQFSPQRIHGNCTRATVIYIAKRLASKSLASSYADCILHGVSHSCWTFQPQISPNIYVTRIWLSRAKMFYREFPPAEQSRDTRVDRCATLFKTIGYLCTHWECPFTEL